jgi:hypothetical protein
MLDAFPLAEALGSDTDALFEGVVASGPDVDGHVEVVIPAFDPDLRHGPCPVMPRGNGFPQRGDRCLVVFADRDRTPWVAAWDGPTTISGIGTASLANGAVTRAKQLHDGPHWQGTQEIQSAAVAAGTTVDITGGVGGTTASFVFTPVVTGQYHVHGQTIVLPSAIATTAIRADLVITVSPADADGRSVRKGIDMRTDGNAANLNWRSISVNAPFRLTAGIAYTLKMSLNPITVAWFYWHGPTYTWLYLD